MTRCTPGIGITRPLRSGAAGLQPAREVAVDAVLVGERFDPVQALGAQPPRPDVHAAVRAGLAHDGLTDQAGLRCVHARRVAAGSAGSRP